MRHLLSFIVAMAAAGSAFAQPSVSMLQNNYSYILPGAPNYGIAPGSLFDIFGYDIVSTSNLAEDFPLTTSLNGVSVSVTVNNVTVQPYLYYVYVGTGGNDQIGAVLPSSTPTGTGTLTVNVGGTPTPPVPITVVPSAFGILTDNGGGFGAAAAFDQNYNYLTFTHPATPGQLIVFWGTGVGADPNNDDHTLPQNANNLTNIPVQFYIGGAAAPVYYKGRSQYPGVDEVLVYVPQGVPLGCYVSVASQSGSIVSNYGTIPVAPSGASTCSDPISFLEQWQTIQGKNSANIGILQIYNETEQTSAGTQTGARAEGNFKTDDAAEIYGELTSQGLVSPGNCLVRASTSNGTPTYLSAGANLTLTGPGAAPEVMAYNGAGKNPSYGPATLSSGFIPAAGGTFTFSAPGGAGATVGSFSVTTNLPAPIAWTNMAAASAITRSQGYTLTWTGGAANQYVLIIGDSRNSGGGTTPSSSATFNCIAPAGPGQFTIPPEVLLAMPVSTTADLGIANFQDIVTFGASGLDIGYVFGYQVSETTVVNYQ